jgi:hypothetical protein
VLLRRSRCTKFSGSSCSRFIDARITTCCDERRIAITAKPRQEFQNAWASQYEFSTLGQEKHPMTQQQSQYSITINFEVHVAFQRPEVWLETMTSASSAYRNLYKPELMELGLTPVLKPIPRVRLKFACEEAMEWIDGVASKDSIVR